MYKNNDANFLEGGRRETTMLIVKSCRSNILNDGLTVVEAYGTRVYDVMTALEKYDIRPLVIIYSMDAAPPNDMQVSLRPAQGRHHGGRLVAFSISLFIHLIKQATYL